jgi:hypothetical protein
MVGVITHVFSATQAEATSNFAGVATTWVGPNEWNSAHQFAVTMTGNTSNVSTVSGTNIILGATQNLTVSGTSNSIYLVGPQLSAWWVGEGTTTSYDASSIAASSASIFGVLFVLPTELAMTRLDQYGSQSIWGMAIAASTSGTKVSSTTGQSWILAGLWSRQQGTSTGTLTLLSSTQYEIQYSASQSESSTSYSNSLSMTWSTGNPFASFSATYSGTNTGTSTSKQDVGLTSGNTGSWTGNFDLPFPFAGTLEPGEYFYGMNIVTSGSCASAGAGLSFSFCKLVPGGVAVNYLGNNPGSTVPGQPYMQGVAMTNGSSAAMPASYVYTNLSPDSLGQPLIQMVNYATNKSAV